MAELTQGGYIQIGSDGKKSVKVTKDQHLFDGKDIKEYPKIARDYLKQNFQGKTVQIDEGGEVRINSRGVGKFSSDNGKLNPELLDAKLRLTPELDNVISISKYRSNKPDTNGKHGGFAKDGFDYHSFKFEVGGKEFVGTVNIGRNGEIRNFYDVHPIKKSPDTGYSSVSQSSVKNNSDDYNSSIPKVSDNVNDPLESLKAEAISSASQAKQTARSASRTEPSVSMNRTVSNQLQAGETPQSVRQGSAIRVAKQSSTPKVSKTSKEVSVRKRTPARSQTAIATTKQSQQSKIAKTGQRVIASYPDNTTNVVNKRGFTQSVKRSGEVSPTTQKAVSGEYNVRSTSKLAISADEYSKGNLNKVTKDVNSRLDFPTGKINDQDIADSIAVAKRLDAKGDFEQATQIYDKLAEHGTKGG